MKLVAQILMFVGVIGASSAFSQTVDSSLPEAFRNPSALRDGIEWLEEVAQASATLRLHVFHPTTWKEKAALRPKGELLNFQSGRAIMAFNPAFHVTGVNLPLTAPKLKTLAELMGPQLGGELQAYGQALMGRRTWIWLQHWMPMPEEGKGFPFDGSLAWTFVSGEGDQFFTITFYVLHVRDAPTAEVTPHVDRAVPVFTEALTRLVVERTAEDRPPR